MLGDEPSRQGAAILAKLLLKEKEPKAIYRIAEVTAISCFKSMFEFELESV
jgi:hypothetical protein